MNVEELIKYSKKNDFWHSQADGYMQSCIGFTYGFANSYKYYPVFINNFIFAIEREHAYEAVSVQDTVKPSEFFLGYWLKDKEYFKTMEQKWRRVEKVQDEIIEILEKADLKKLSDQEILELYTRLQDISIDFWAYMGLPEVVGIFEQDIYPDQVKKKLKISDKEYSEIATVLADSGKASFTTKFESSIGEIKNVIDHKNNPERLIKRLIKDYYWIRTGYHGAPDLKTKEILEEVRGYKKPSLSVSDKRIVIEKYRIKQDIIDVFDFIALMAYWRDERKRISLPAMFWVFKICDEVARRNKLDFKLIYSLGFQKMKDFLSGKTAVFDNDCENHVTSHISKVGVKYYYGTDHKKLFESFFNQEDSKDTLLTGMMTSRAGEGKIIGVARIVLNPANTAFKKGEILIAPMTRPEYAPLMKKAKAIITDQGGITSHAAIVSREFGIPCVVGTRFASKILKDGDIIEFNTNHGTVRKI